MIPLRPRPPPRLAPTIALRRARVWTSTACRLSQRRPQERITPALHAPVRGLVDVLHVDRTAAGKIRIGEHGEAEEIDEPRDAAAVVVNGLDGLVVDHLGIEAAFPQTMAEILAGLAIRQRCEVIDAIRYRLLVREQRQHVWLAHQQQLSVDGIEQTPQLREVGRLQGLGVVDDLYHRLIAGARAVEKLLKALLH